MILTADYHTHTTYSHGKGSVIDNARVAKEKGLIELGISDHGFSHPAFGLTKRKLPKLREDINFAKSQTGVNVLLGIESNIIGVDGTVDLKEKLYDKFDIFLAGVHKCVMYKFGAIFSMSIPNLAHVYLKMKASDNLIKRNTTAYINTIKNNPVDIITHLGYCCPCNPVEVAKVAADYGTCIEISAKKIHLSKEELYQMGKTGVKFVLSSDAHTPNRVGEISLALSQLQEVDIPRENVVNVDGRLPEFRFKKFKERL